MNSTRQHDLAYLQENSNPTVLIIGGGVNGIGTFRDLALQGVDVLLVEKNDFASGASAASSHMAHGGIRYLENGEFRLVREAVRERNRMIQNAAHYVKPLPTTIPIFKWWSGIFNAPLKFLRLLDKPSERGAVIIKMGLIMYDAYTGANRTVPRHKLTFRKQALAKYPKLNPEILCTASYYDGAIIQPERLCVEMILDTETDCPHAKAINYMEASGAEDDTVVLKDALTGETYTVKPKIVINAAGPWIDFANQALGKQTKFIGGTKGSHLILDHPELRTAIGESEFFFENKDGRIVLIYPLMDKVMIGTSDLYIENPDDARCTDEEIGYFFEMLDKVFPSIKVDRSQIVFQFSGVRPLPASDAKRAGQVSRDHSIRETESGNGLHFPIFSLVGGKWTSFRAFSEQVADKILSQLERPRLQTTHNLGIGGGRDYPHETEGVEDWIAFVEKKTGLSAERVRQLFDHYGTRAAEIAGFISVSEDHPLEHHPAFSVRELTYLAQSEKVVHIDDFLLRRSLVAMLGEVTRPLVEELADVFGDALGWDETQKAAEIAHTVEILHERNGVTL